MRPRPRRRALTLTEIAIAVAVLAAVLIPAITMFQTATKQTQNVRSRVAARAVADWALSQARSLVTLGQALPENRLSLTQDARARFAETVAQLRDLDVRRTVVPRDAGATLYRIEVEVSWRDPGIEVRREVRVEVLERSEI